MSDMHANGPQEHALCGLAFDAFESGDYHEPVVFAAPGEMVTCGMCRAFLAHIRANFKGNRAVRATSDTGSKTE